MPSRSPINVLMVAFSAVLTAGATAGGLEVPATLRSAVQEVDAAWGRGDQDAAVRAAEVAVAQVEEWVVRALRDHGVADVVKALETSIPVVTPDLRPRSRPADELLTLGRPFTVGLAVWTRGERELLIVRAEVMLEKYGQYFPGSKLPLLIAKEGANVTAYKEPTIDPASQQIMIGFLGGQNNEAWPDVLVGDGPHGQSLAFHIFQYHFEAEPVRKWTWVWAIQQECAFTKRIDFEAKSGLLTLECGWPDYVTAVDTFRLHHGQKAQRVGERKFIHRTQTPMAAK